MSRVCCSSNDEDMSEHNECVEICDHINTDNDDIEDEDNCYNLAAARIDVDACVDDIRV